MEQNNNSRDFHHHNDPRTVPNLDEDEETETSQYYQQRHHQSEWLSHPGSALRTIHPHPGMNLPTLPEIFDTGFEDLSDPGSFGLEHARDVPGAMATTPNITKSSDIEDNDSDIQRKLDSKAGIAVQYPLSPSNPNHSFDEGSTSGIPSMDSPDMGTALLSVTTSGRQMTAPPGETSHLVANPSSFSDSLADYQHYQSIDMTGASSPFQGSYQRHYRRNETDDSTSSVTTKRLAHLPFTQVGVSHPINAFPDSHHHLLHAAHHHQYYTSMFYYPYYQEDLSEWDINDSKPSPKPRPDPSAAREEPPPTLHLPDMGGPRVASRPSATSPTDTATATMTETSASTQSSPPGMDRQSTRPKRTRSKRAVAASPKPPENRPPRTAKKAPPTETSRGTAGTTRERQRGSPPPDEELTTRARNALITWHQRLDELVEYKRIHGDTNVPQKYPENPSLGIWVNKQRMEMKFRLQGDPSSMTPQKIQELEDVDFIWAKRKGEAAWEEKYKELAEFRRRNGHCNVPTKHSSNRALGRWVSTQRSQYKKFMRRDRCHMTQERIEKLDALGFIWRMTPPNLNTNGIPQHNLEALQTPTVSSPPSNEDDDEEDSDTTTTTPPESDTGSSP